MKRKTRWATVWAVAALTIVCAVFASNMIFKLKRSFEGPQPNVALPLDVTSGTNSLALPFNPQTSLIDAETLLKDINDYTGDAAEAVVKYVKSSDQVLFYNGYTGVNFVLTPGEGYLVQMKTERDYLIVGTHNPGLTITLLGPAGGSSGTNLYAHPYHAVASTAGELINEIGSGVVLGVSRWVNSADVIDTYVSGGDNFTLFPGEAYFITVSADVSFIPAHY